MFSSFLLSAGLMLNGLAASLSAYEAGPMVDSLEAVTVSADKGITISRKDTIQSHNTFSLSEALMKSSSLQIHDNGGFSGLKTVSLRGMGSAHTAIYIDGIRVGNIQSGQCDLEMYGRDNSLIIIDYAQNSINISTFRPTFDKLPISGQVQLHGGSFGTYLPYARLDFRLSDNLSLSANVSGVFSEGNFTYGDGQTRYNNDIARIRGGLDLFGLVSDGHYHIKAAYNNAERGTPGSASWPSTDRQKDMNAYLQGSMTVRFSDLYRLRANVKGSYDDILYLSEWGDSRYKQSEVQLNTVHEFNIKDWWTLSLAADICWDGLKSNVYGGNRLSSLYVLASAFRVGKFSTDLALEYCFASDQDKMFRDAISPSANLRFSVTDNLVISALGRRMYRIPTFNELYYPGYGNPELKPEDAWTTNLSADYNKAFGQGWKIIAGISGFHIALTDKIISAPTDTDPNVWLPYNIGKVRSLGMDLKAGISHSCGDLAYGLHSSYTLLSSTDRTSDSYSYGTQVAYTAKHSMITTGEMSWKGWKLNPAWILKRGYCGSDGKVYDWNTVDLTLSKSINIRNICTFTLSLSSRNIADTRYEILSGYPMPGRSFIGGLEFKF